MATAKKAGRKPSTRRAPVQTTVRRNPPGQTPDVLALLSADHAEVHAHFERYRQLVEQDADSDERGALAERICSMLSVHATLEEQFFYPAARAAGVESDLLDEADVEHASAKSLIAQIEALSPGDRLYDAKVIVLGEYVDHHVAEEEGELFPQCRASGMDLREIVMPMAQRRVELMEAEIPPAEEGNLVTRLASKALQALKSD